MRDADGLPAGLGRVEPSWAAAAPIELKNPDRKLSAGELRALPAAVRPSSPVTTQSVNVPPTSIEIT